MKSQVVIYRDLFNPEENILAKNKLPRRQQYTTTALKSSVKGFMVDKKKRECKCKHLRIGESGMCNNGRCRHFEADHKQYAEVNYASYW